MLLRLSLILIILLIALTSGVRSQNISPPVPGPRPPSEENTLDEENQERIRKTLEKKQNQERHDQIKRDTDKLLQLSTELKQYVDKTNQNVMSIDVIKKAEEIEKLAHSVKEKMKG